MTTQSQNADEIDTTKVAVDCDCPNCNATDSVEAKQYTIDAFDDGDRISVECSECGFHFRADHPAGETENDVSELSEGDNVTVSYTMLHDSHEHTVTGTVQNVRDEAFDHKTLVVEADGMTFNVDNITRTVKVNNKTIAKNAQIK